MSTEPKEIVAIAHAILGLNESALKQLTVIFNRIGIQGLSMDLSNVPFISPDFINLRTWLAELGVLFDLDLDKLKTATAHDYAKTRDMLREDTDSFTKPTFGMTAKEMVAAREDEEKMAELKKRSREGDKRFADGSIDAMTIHAISLRLSTNMIRMFASQLRDIEDVDAYPVIPSDFSSLEQDDPRLVKHDVVKISLSALPVPVEDMPWQQIIEYRNDGNTKDSFLHIKELISEIARGTFTLFQVEETLEYLLNRFRTNLETHQINATTMALAAYVIAKPEFIQTLAGAGPDWGSRTLFSVEHRKIGLLEGESTSAGSAVAFLTQMNMASMG